MHRNGQILCFAAGVFLLITSVAYPLSIMAASSSPLQVIQSGSDSGLRIIKSSLFEGGPSLQQHRDEILKIVEEYFDFNEMAKRALGRPWKEISQEEQQEFVRLFKQLLFNTYVRRIEATAAPTTSTRYDGETIEGRFAVVKTRVTSVNQPDFQIEYRLLVNGEEWKVYDILIEGISLVSNYRQQFSSILNNESFENLLKRLKEKVETQSAS
jgi:phospholipid transport system substrate-binding protein